MDQFDVGVGVVHMYKWRFVNMKVLLVIDMQNDFIDEALGTAEAVSIVPNVQKKIQKCVESGYEIIFTRDTHQDNYMETQEGQKLPVPHCIEGTHGWEISDKLTVGGAKVVDKPTFGSVELMNYLADKESEIEEVELVGLCTDICVISNAMLVKAAMPEVKVVVDSACCAGVTPGSHNNALEAMKMCQIEIR